MASLLTTVDDAQSKTVIDEGQIAAPVERAVGVLMQVSQLPSPLAPAMGNEADQSGHLAAIDRLREEISHLRSVADKTDQQAFRVIDALVEMEDMLRAHVGAHGHKLLTLAAALAAEGVKNGADTTFRDIKGEATGLYDTLGVASESMGDAKSALTATLDLCELNYVQRAGDTAAASTADQLILRGLMEEEAVRKEALREAARKLADTAERRKAMAVRCGILERTAALLEEAHLADAHAISSAALQADKHRAVLDARRGCVEKAVAFVEAAQQAVDAG